MVCHHHHIMQNTSYLTYLSVSASGGGSDVLWKTTKASCLPSARIC